MTVDSIKASTIVNSLQFKSHAHQALTKDTRENAESKKNGNKLLYGSLAALAVLGTGYTIARKKFLNARDIKDTAETISETVVKEPAKLIDTLKGLGYQVKNGLMCNAEGKPISDVINHHNLSNGSSVALTYQEGILREVIKVDKASNTLMSKTFKDKDCYKVITKEVLKPNGETYTTITTHKITTK